MKVFEEQNSVFLLHIQASDFFQDYNSITAILRELRSRDLLVQVPYCHIARVVNGLDMKFTFQLKGICHILRGYETKM